MNDLFRQDGVTVAIPASGSAELPGKGDVLRVLVNPVNLSGGGVNPVVFVATGPKAELSAKQGYPVFAGSEALLKIGADHKYVAVHAEGSPAFTLLTRGWMGGDVPATKVETPKTQARPAAAPSRPLYDPQTGERVTASSEEPST